MNIFNKHIFLTCCLASSLTYSYTLNRDFGYEQFRTPPNAYSLISATNSTWIVANSKNSNPTWDRNCTQGNLPINLYPIFLDTQPEIQWEGGTVYSEVPQESEFNPTYCNSSALTVWNSNNAIISGLNILGAWDAFRFARNTNNFTLAYSRAQNVRDDCIENDQLKSGLLYHVIFDGCFVGISMRPGAGNTIEDQRNLHTLRLDYAFIRLKSYPWRKSSTDLLRITHGHIFKMDSRSPSVFISNSIFAYESSTPFASMSNMRMVFERLKLCENNHLLWMGDGPVPMYFSEFPSSCFKVLQGEEAKTFWAHAVNQRIPKEPTLR